MKEIGLDDYKYLYENSPDMHVSVDPNDATIKTCNQTTVDRLGYKSKEDIIGKPIFSLYHPDCLPDVEKAFKSFVETEEVKNARLDLKKVDGSKIPVMLNVKAIKDENGKIIYSNSSWRDISDIVLLERKYQELVSTLPITIWVADKDGKITYFNHQWKEMTGYEPEEVYGYSWITMIHKDDRERVVNDFNNSIISKKYIQNEFRLVHKNG